MKSVVYALIFSLLTASIAFSADTITPEDAINHIGQEATVCGTVSGANYSSRSDGQPTYINLNRPYPNEIFTILIWGVDRNNFPGAPENYYKSKRICVSGKIEEYKGTPQIIVRSANQIREEK